MLAILLVIGGIRIAQVLGKFFVVFPVAAVTAIVLFTAYAVPFVLLVRTVDYLERESVGLRVVAFAWGGVVATSAAIAGGSAVSNLLARMVSPRFTAQWGPAIAGAGVEEVVKVLGVVAIALVARTQIKNIVDGIGYGALIGLGFQVVEDVVFAMNAVAVSSGSDRVGPVVMTFLLRGFLGGLWSHTLFGALAGAGVAYAMVRKDRSRLVRFAVAAALCGSAWWFHFLWNSPLLADGFGYGIVGVLAAMLIKGIPALAVGVVLVVAAQRHQADYYAAMLASVGDHRIATRDEIATLISPRGRAAARRHARTRLGRPGARAVRRLQLAQARLAVSISTEPGVEVCQRRHEVLVRRHELLALAMAASRRNPSWAKKLAASAAVTAQVVGALFIVIAIGVAIFQLGGT